MPNITGQGLSIPTASFPGGNSAGVPTGIAAELLGSRLLARYSTLVKAGKVYYASLAVAAPGPVIFSSGTNQAGPVIWNKPSSNVDAHILGVLVGSPTVAYDVAGAIGFATTVQSTQPAGASIAVVTSNNCLAGGGRSQMGGIFNLAVLTVLPAPTFLPLAGVTTGAISTRNTGGTGYIDTGGFPIIAPGFAGYVCASATQTNTVVTLGLVWAELPA